MFLIPANAQYRASLQGSVVDAQGAMIPGAQITLTDKETNRTITVTSNETGSFNFNALAPSTYGLVATRTGFKKKELTGVQILAEQSNTLNFVMEVGAATETVTVNVSEAPQIDTATGSISGTIDQNSIARMPSFGRDVFQLVQLAPGMFGDGAQGSSGGSQGLPGSNSGGSGSTDGVFKTENQPQSTAGGNRTNSNGISLDGVAITSVTWGGAAVITPSEDSIKEMKVIANPYDAEYGRVSGAQIQIISQNGTNQYHGSGFFKVDRPGLNAKQRWEPNSNPQKNASRFNQFGGTVGGPILHNKLFGFFSYETIRNHSTQYPSGWYETAAFDGLSTSGTIAAKYLTLKGGNAAFASILEGASDNHGCASVNLQQGVNCNWIQGKGLDLGKPLTIGVGKHDPSYANTGGTGTYTPGLGGDGTGSYASNMDGVADLMYISAINPTSNINQQFNVRLDYQATAKDLFAISTYYVPVSSSSYNGAMRASNIFYHNAKNYSIGAIYNHTFSDTMLNEARADMAGWKWNEVNDNPQSPLGLPDDVIQSTSGNSFSSVVPATFGPSLGSIFDQWTLNFKDTLTKVHRAHNIRIGGQVTRLAYLDAPTWDGEPTYYFNNLWDFLNDAPQAENVTVDPTTGKPSWFRKDDRQNIIAFFAQDDWKLRPNLSVNLGLRWEYFGGMTEKSGKEPNVRLGTGSATLTNLAIKLGGSQVNAPKFNFGPQLGFAWSPVKFSNKLVLRGGFGIGFTGLELAITTNTRNNPPYLASNSTLTGSNILYGTASNIFQGNAFPSNPAMITTFNAANLPVNGLATGVTALPEDLPTSYVYRYSLQGQYDLGHQWVATLGYQGSLGRHLTVQTNLLNKLASQIRSGAITANGLVNGIDWYENSGNSSFHALLGEVRHQFAHSFEADAQYRWSKSVDDGSQPYANSEYEFAPGYSRGPSDFDTRHMVKIFALWSPVIFHGQQSWLEKVGGGWTFSPIFNFHSGFPWNPVYSNLGADAVYKGSSNNGGTSNLRPAAYKGGGNTSQSTDSFKTSAGHFPNGGTTYFTAPAVTVGNDWSTSTAPTFTALPGVPGIERNTFTGPRYSDIDFAVTKAFGLPNMKVLGEKARFEIRANAYNLFNKLNLYSPNTNIYSTDFGKATSALGSRTVELEAHFKF